MTGLLIAGTTSDAGKSVVTTGLCRAFARRGVRVAPFKAQNMSNNSMVCGLDAARPTAGAEIGRAQWTQALAAGVTPEPAMNPVLLKPGSDHRSHVVIMGQPGGEIAADDFIGGRRHLAEAAFAAYDDLAARYDVIIAEGAGSPAEINLRGSDYVNLGLAQHGQLPTIVVGDIDRGGVFASLFGTVTILDAADQALIKGFVINKFRGNRDLLAPGLDRLTELTGRPTYGVLPWRHDIWLDSEDAVELDQRRTEATARVRIAVVRLPRISNFTDVDALALEPDIDVSFVSDPRDLGDADLVVLPGTRATLPDLAWLRSRGLDDAIRAHAEAGRPVLGICGGFQMLGRHVIDRDGVEGQAGSEVAGLGLLDVVTEFETAKTLALTVGEWRGVATSGYEIHHGRVTRHGGEDFLGGAQAGQVYGTLWHGSLENDAFRGALLGEMLGRMPSSVSFAAAREKRLEVLGDLVEEHLDMAAIMELVQ